MPTRREGSVSRRKTADDGGVHVNFITHAKVTADGSIHIRTRGSSADRTLSPMPGAAGEQLATALVEQAHVNGGTWTSWATMHNQHYSSRRFLGWLLAEHGIDDLTDPAMTPSVAWEGVASVGSNGGPQRNFRTFLARALLALREDAVTHQSVLRGRALPVDVHNLEGYAPEVADSIERVARTYVGRWFVRHRKAVKQALGGDLPVNWMRLPATDLCGQASTCPEAFKVTVRDLSAAMVLLSLIDDKGPNLSVIQSHTSDSVEAAGHTAFVTSVKARNRQVLRTPAPSGGIFSYGGLLEFVAAATRVERHFRDDGSDFGRLLFVASDRPSVMNAQQVRSWWSTTVFDWPNPEIPRPGLSFPRLRKAALLRGKKHSRGVIGHGPRTARLYLADALPDVILIPGLVETQNSVTAYCRAQMLHPRPADSNAAEQLTAAASVMDVGVAMCASGGQSANDSEKPCGLGPVACFICPNGFRTPEVIPGLIAAVEFTDNIRKHEPAAWISSEAPALNALARKALNQFPRPVVAAASREDVHNARALVACVYMEGRRVD